MYCLWSLSSHTWHNHVRSQQPLRNNEEAGWAFFVLFPCCFHTYIHTYIHIYTHIHTYIHTYIYIYTYININTGVCCLPGDHRMHYGKKASRRRWCDALGNVLLGNLGSCHPWGCYFDRYHLPKHCYWPLTSFHANSIHWWLWPLSKKLFRNGLRNKTTGLRCLLGLQFPRSQSNWESVGCAGQTSLIRGDPTSQLTGFKGSAPNILVPDTTAHLQGYSGVHASMGQGGFGSKRGTNTVLGRWS